MCEVENGKKMMISSDQAEDARQKYGKSKNGSLPVEETSDLMLQRKFEKSADTCALLWASLSEEKKEEESLRKA